MWLWAKIEQREFSRSPKRSPSWWKYSSDKEGQTETSSRRDEAKLCIPESSGSLGWKGWILCKGTHLDHFCNHKRGELHRKHRMRLNYAEDLLSFPILIQKVLSQFHVRSLFEAPTSTAMTHSRTESLYWLSKNEFWSFIRSRSYPSSIEEKMYRNPPASLSSLLSGI